MPVQPKVYIIILNYNNWPDTIECLESVLQLKYDNFRAVVVDNRSTDNSVRKIFDWGERKLRAGDQPEIDIPGLDIPGITRPLSVQYVREEDLEPSMSEYPGVDLALIQASENFGFAAGNNLGIRYGQALGDAAFFWVLNNDTVVKPNSLTALVDRHRAMEAAGEKPGILGSKLLFYDRPKVLQGVGGKLFKRKARVLQVGTHQEDNGQFDEPVAGLDYVIGASLFVSDAFVQQVGPLSEEYFLYYEEIDWAMRAKNAGYSISYAPGSVVYHKQGASTGNTVDGKKNPASMFYQYRNLIRFYRKFFPGLVPVAWLVVLLRILKRCVTDSPAYLKLIFPVFLQRQSYS